jgi:hypothetical protein
MFITKANNWILISYASKPVLIFLILTNNLSALSIDYFDYAKFPVYVCAFDNKI